MNRRPSAWAAILLVGIVALDACASPSRQVFTPLPTVVDRGLAHGVPCQPPCWEGLTPGLSTEQEVRQRLEELLAEGQITSYYCPAGTAEGICSAYGWEVPWRPVNIRFKDGTVVQISGFILFDFEVQQLVDAVGEPGWVYLMGGPGGPPARDCTCEKSTPVPDPPGHVDYTSFVYPERGLLFGIDVHLSQVGCICPYAKVDTFSYYPPAPSLAAFLDYRRVVHGGPETPGPNSLKPSDYIEWHGFGPGYGRK